MKKKATTIILQRVARRLGIHERIESGDTLFMFESINYRQGIVVERTPYKNSYYVWYIIMPRFSLYESRDLSFGRRIRQGELFVGDVDSLCNQIVEIISDNSDLTPILNAELTDEEFLKFDGRILSYPGNFPIRAVRDVAVALKLCQKTHEALRLLNFVAGSGKAFGDDRLLESVREEIRCIQKREDDV